MKDDGPRYILYDDEDKPRRWTRDKLRRKIKARDVAGDELVRLEDEPEAALRPLYTDALFQQVHNVGPEQAELVAHANHARGLLVHAAVFVAVLTFLGWPFWSVFWGLGLFFHAARSLGHFSALKRDAQGKAALLGLPLQKLAAPEALDAGRVEPAAETAASEAAEPAEEDPVASEALREWKRVDSVLERVDDRTRQAIEQARASLERLLARRRELAEHLDGEDDDDLDRERADLETDLAVDGLDARTREALETSMHALESRREGAAAARGAADRARARARSLVHQLKSLRLHLVSHDAADARSHADLGRMVDGLREQTRAMAELEEALVEARATSDPARRADRARS